MEFMTIEVMHQCAWCTEVTDGEEQGVLYFQQQQGLHLLRLPNYSHVCCPECRKRQFDSRKRERRTPPVQEGVLLLGGEHGITPTK